MRSERVCSLARYLMSLPQVRYCLLLPLPLPLPLPLLLLLYYCYCTTATVPLLLYHCCYHCCRTMLCAFCMLLYSNHCRYHYRTYSQYKHFCIHTPAPLRTSLSHSTHTDGGTDARGSVVRAHPGRLRHPPHHPARGLPLRRRCALHAHQHRRWTTRTFSHPIPSHPIPSTLSFIWPSRLVY
jgi:hypothetical protein